MSGRNTDEPIRRKATRDQWMLDYWNDPARHTVIIEERRDRVDDRIPEYRSVCSCGWMTDTPFKRPDPCPVAEALGDRAKRIERARRQALAEASERPRREWKAVNL
jgi:hypothetical protein